VYEVKMDIKQMRELREKMGLSQTEIAQMMNVHRITICRLENGRQGARPLTLHTLEKLFSSLERRAKEKRSNG
jgi:transcriptional regulator with XRE-family HTH domain